MDLNNIEETVKQQLIVLKQYIGFSHGKNIGHWG